MGQTRSKKRVVVISSDEGESDGADGDILTDTEENTAIKDKPQGPVSKAPRKKASEKSKALPTKKPATQRPTRKPAKAAQDDDPKKAKGTIHSFFNAATQKQQTSQRPLTLPKPSSTKFEEEEILDTISGDDAPVPFATGSQTALAHKKRKLNINEPGFGLDAVGPLTQKFRKTADGLKVPSHTHQEDRRPWTERFAPVDLSELAVHKKKLTDVRSLLESAFSSRPRPRLMVLKGAAGTGKTTAINLLAKDLGVDVLEWKNPVAAAADSDGVVTVSAQFEDFVLRTSRTAGLQLSISGDAYAVDRQETEMSTGKQLILVEEFPNTFARSSNVLQSFRSTVQQCLSIPLPPGQRIAPIVMIISETLLSTSTSSADSFTAHRLLGPQILTHPLTAEIEFNAVAPTILTKALETIVVKEARKSGRKKTPGPGVLKRLAETGDIRSAVSSLEFLCLRGDSDPEAWSARVAFTKPKKASRDAPLTKQEYDALKLISNRESSLGIFHAVGKVVYNKRIDPEVAAPQPPNYLPQCRKLKVPETDIDALIDELGTDTSTFLAALHENYALSCSSTSAEDSLDALDGCLDFLSDADLLAPDRFNAGTRAFSGSTQDSLRQDEMSFQVAVRGLLFSLPSPVSRAAGTSGKGRSDAHRMFWPASLKLWKKREEVDGLLDLIVAQLHSPSSADDAAGRRARAEEGVLGWKTGHAPTPVLAAQEGEEDEDDDDAQGTSLLPLVASSARSQILLERLPFLSKILSHRPNAPPVLTERITTLTSFTGLGIGLGDEGSDAADEGDWTADKVDADGNRGRRHGKGKDRGEREGGGLNIPVEHAVERLVLSDDDIVDE